ncbi:hypothetical protein [Pectobacterium aquaticum]|uniref:hypothetical protein n=1 Tax=Pectobacterium aquaticum TaxID=2204145 RepID=UPI000E244EAB|nr:hypothetical protein [Pectobacterium aquaticum]UEM40151.1 hypothetical protein DMB82_0003720 [Pectobacterium aquaticum]
MSQEKARRQRNARSDASVGSIEKHIEKTYGLPEGSVQINNKNGKNSRSDQKIKTLRKQHD